MAAAVQHVVSGVVGGLAVILCLLKAAEPSVPLIELDGSDASRAALLKAASELGVFRIRVAPFLPAEGIESALNASRELFLSGDEEKRSWPVVHFPPVAGAPASIARGYIPFGGESGVGGRYFEVKEGFAYSHESGCSDASGTEAHALEFCNAWPAGREIFRMAVSQLFDGSFAAAREAIRQLAIGAGASGEAVVASLDEGLPSSVMRLFHYHSRHYCRDTNRSECASRVSLEQTGSSPHTDWHALTVIAEGMHSKQPTRRGEIGAAMRRWLGGPTGLQFRARGSERWRSVRTGTGELVVVLGDLLALGSQGKFHSPVHRVLLPVRSGETRTSFTLFAYPRGTDTIGSWVRMLAPVDAEGHAPTARQIDELLAEARRRASGGGWNTLLAQSGADAGAEEPFERILLRKWRGVSTADDARRPDDGATASI